MLKENEDAGSVVAMLMTVSYDEMLIMEPFSQEEIVVVGCESSLMWWIYNAVASRTQED